MMFTIYFYVESNSCRHSSLQPSIKYILHRDIIDRQPSVFSFILFSSSWSLCDDFDGKKLVINGHKNLLFFIDDDDESPSLSKVRDMQ
jgi:hypothetical protein